MDFVEYYTVGCQSCKHYLNTPYKHKHTALRSIRAYFQGCNKHGHVLGIKHHGVISKRVIHVETVHADDMEPRKGTKLHAITNSKHVNRRIP